MEESVATDIVLYDANWVIQVVDSAGAMSNAAFSGDEDSRLPSAWRSME